MDTYSSTISSQNQVTLPAKVRRQLGLNPGDTLIWQVNKDALGTPHVVARPGTVAALKSLRGVAKDLYRKHGGGKKVLDQERNSWDQ